MDTNAIFSLLAMDGYWMVNKTIAKALGIIAAVILGDLCSQLQYWSSRGETDEDGWFFCTVDTLESNTGISAHQQREAIRVLEERGIIEVERRGIPARRFFKLHADAIEKIFNPDLEDEWGEERPEIDERVDNKLLKNSTTEASNFEHLDTQNLNSNKNKLSNTVTNEKGSTKKARASGSRTEKPIRKIVPPQREWVEEYCRERGNNINAQKFCDYYEACGWMTGRHKMKDWQAAVRTWEARDNERARKGTKGRGIDFFAYD
jgi:predicted transcriptional regulator